MKPKQAVLYVFAALLCFFASGCFNIEQEIFLNADGSGEFVLHIGMPDFPEKMGSSSLEMSSKKDPKEEMEKFKKEMTQGLPPTIVVKDVKEIKQNGSMSLYAVYVFKKLQDVQTILSNFGKESLKDEEMKAKPEWTVTLEKKGGKTVYTGKFLLDMSEEMKKKEEKKKTEGATEPGFEEFEKLGEEMMQMMLGMIKMRFVLHAPSPITETNADIVLNEKTAVWNCSMIAFVKDKKPIEMKASF